MHWTVFLTHSPALTGLVTYLGWQRWGSLARSVDLPGAPALALLADLLLATHQPHPVGEHTADHGVRPKVMRSSTPSLLLGRMVGGGEGSEDLSIRAWEKFSEAQRGEMTVF